MSKLCLQQSLAATGLGAVVNRLQNVLADPRDKCPKQTKATLPIDGPAVFGIRSHHFNTKTATTHCSLRARLNHVCSKCSRRVVKKWIHNGILLEELLYSFNLKVLRLCGVSEAQRKFHLVDDQEEESKGQTQQTIDFNSNSTDFNSLKFEISADMQQNTQWSIRHLIFDCFRSIQPPEPSAPCPPVRRRLQDAPREPLQGFRSNLIRI